MSENQEPLKQTTKSNLIYEMNEEEKTANIIGNDNASGEVMIQCSIKLGKKKIYQVISIKEGSFEDSKTIQSILLNEKSKIQKICKNTFLNSTIESLSLSANVSDLEEG